MLTACRHSASIATPVVGRLGDMTGKERVFVAALAAPAVGCLTAALATTLTALVLAGPIVDLLGPDWLF